MPTSLETPVLQVDTNMIHKVDTSNPENLYSMWTVFARCADSVVQGRRLENLSWRLWNRETFCCEQINEVVAPTATTLPRDIQPPSRTIFSDDLPQLSGSVESVFDEEAVEFTSDLVPVDIVRPRIRRQDSCASSRSRGKERHISSDSLEKMVVSIIEAKEPLTAPLPALPSPLPLSDIKAMTAPEIEHSGSTSTESPCKTSETPSMESLQPASSPDIGDLPSRTIVTRGFSPSQISLGSVNRIISLNTQSLSLSTIPHPEETPAPKIVQSKKPAKFALGGSSGDEDSFSDPEHSLESRPQQTHLQPPLKKKMFMVGESSEEDGSLKMKSALHLAKSGSQLTAQKKTASFNAHPVTKMFPSQRNGRRAQFEIDDESAIEDTEELEDSAIDDEEDWEDSNEDSAKSSMDGKIHFQRVDSKVNIASRRSLITLMLAQNERSQRLGNNASQSTSAIPRGRPLLNGPSLVSSPNDSDDSQLMMRRSNRAPPMRPITEIPRSAAQPINAPGNGINHQAALSPRTTRRNMLATELTESLRRHLLWERSQKSQTANAVLKRRHTSHDVANLKQYPERAYMKNEDDVNAGSSDQYFNKNSFTGYHAQGW